MDQNGDAGVVPFANVAQNQRQRKQHQRGRIEKAVLHVGDGKQDGGEPNAKDWLERASKQNFFAHARAQGYDLRFALEPKPNEPRGDLLLPTVGHALAFIDELEWPDMVGLNPEFAHETMSGLSFTHAVAQALWHDKLFHIDLNAQRIGKFDQDFRFGSEGLRDAFYLVKLLEESGWDGMRHFDAHAYRTEDADGVWDFARGCMRTYLILKERAARFADDPDIREALAVAQHERLAVPTSPGGLTPEAIAEIRGDVPDESALAARGYGHERLDQLVTELLLGAR